MEDLELALKVFTILEVMVLTVAPALASLLQIQPVWECGFPLGCKSRPRAAVIGLTR